MDELGVAGGELGGDAGDEGWSQVKSIKSFPNLAEGESGQPVKSQEGIPAASVSKYCNINMIMIMTTFKGLP